MSDTSILDELNINVNSLKEICPSIISTRQYDSGIGIDVPSELELEMEEDNLLLYQKTYFDKVEEGNQYVSELKKIEKQYIEKKYGPEVYNYLEEERKTYIDNEISCNNISNDIDMVTLTNEWNTYKALHGTVMDDFELLMEKKDEMKSKNALNKRRFMYRNEASNDISRQTIRIFYIYYFLLIAIMIFLYANGILEIKKNIFLYLCLIIFPFIYRYLFAFMLWVYTTYIHIRPPKKAFTNTEEPVFLDD